MKYIAIVLTFLGTLNTIAFCQGYNQIRIARYGGGLSFETFCQRAQRAEYNYVIAGSAFDSSHQYMTQYLTNCFNFAGNAGLRLIPEIAISSGSSCSLRERSGNINIERNIISRTSGNYGCNEFAPHEIGTDATFLSILNSIQTAYQAAQNNNPPYPFPIEYILATHDEFAYAWEEVMEIGGGPSWMSLEFSYVDRNLINYYRGLGYDITTAFNIVIVSEIFRRLGQVQQIFPSAKMIIYGDSFDPDGNGGYPLRTFLSSSPSDNTHSVQLTPQIATLPYLSTADRAKFRNDVIIMPWAYNTKTGTYAQCQNGTMHNYNATGTFTYLANNGFKFIYLSAIPNANPCAFSGDRLTEGLAMMNNYISASRSFQNNCIGYACSYWNSDETDYGIIEAMFNANIGQIPPHKNLLNSILPYNVIR